SAVYRRQQYGFHRLLFSRAFPPLPDGTFFNSTGKKCNEPTYDESGSAAKLSSQNSLTLLVTQSVPEERCDRHTDCSSWGHHGRAVSRRSGAGREEGPERTPGLLSMVVFPTDSRATGTRHVIQEATMLTPYPFQVMPRR